MNLTVKGCRVFIRPDKLPEMNEAGNLHLVNDRSESMMKGTVVAVGDGPEFAQRAADTALRTVIEKASTAFPLGFLQAAVDNARKCLTYEHLVQPGDRVLFSPNAGEELIFEKDLLLSMREDDILAVIDAE